MAILLACLENMKECVDYIKTFVSTVSAQQEGQGRGGKQGSTRGGHAGNLSARTSRFWKCDYCSCDCHPKSEPCGCACSFHEKEECPKPDPTKTKAYRKRKAEQVQRRSANQQENLKQNLEGPSLTTFTQDPADQITQEESEDEILSFIVKETEAEPQPLQKPFEILQREEEPKAQGCWGMTCQ